MSTRQEENDIYIIPPNFISTGNEPSGHACMSIWRLL